VATVTTLGKLQQTGALDSQNRVLAGGWTVTFDQSDLPRIKCEVYHMAVKGPVGSTFQVYIDDTFYDNVVRGDINSWDPSQPMILEKDSTVYFYYDTTTLPAPKISLFFREYRA
jgi:hypothetical protein